MVIHRCGQDDRKRAAAYRRRSEISVLATTRAGRLDSYLIRHPRLVVERRSTLKRHCPKLTVFRAAANRSAAFQSASLGSHGGAVVCFRYGAAAAGPRVKVFADVPAGVVAAGQV